MRLSTTTHIAASAASIWDVLTDYPDHETWNPFVVSAALAKPNRLNVMIDPDPEDRMLGFQATIRKAEHASMLDMDLHFGPPVLLYGKYRATFSLSGGRTLFNQEVRFGGPYLFEDCAAAAFSRRCAIDPFACRFAPMRIEHGANKERVVCL